jgi:four helix bundle protein
MFPKRKIEYDFEKLNVYQEALLLTENVYRLTKTFPPDEQYSMKSQLRRAAMSVALNIAEGKGRYHAKVFTQFFYHARGSLFEVMTALKLSYSLGYLGEKEVGDTLDQADKLAAYLNNLIKSLSQGR